jgi:UDP-GlcNAc:undecaprenyl-phosphate/decaprenyl-phosphate GlcNAc-1-phosphate transferase
LSTEVRLALAFALGAGATFALTPLARRLALATGFLDVPHSYKAHREPTPYLGGLALVGGFTVSALVCAVAGSGLWPVLAGALALCAVGTWDDRVSLGALPRVFAAGAVAVFLWATDLGWDVFGSGPVDLAFTVLWVVALVNAFNLFDNLDGAAASLGGVAAGGVALVAATEHEAHLAALALALCGACVGFLPFNLSRPRATIFLGDGGSMVIGFVIAATTMSISLDAAGGISPALAAVVLAGLAVADTLLVIISRLRRRVSILTAGRDHLTHRLAARLGSPRAVALAVGLTQAALALAVLAATRSGAVAVAVIAAAYGVATALGIYLLERPAPAPRGRAAAGAVSGTPPSSGP